MEFDQEGVASITLCTDGVADDLEGDLRSAFFRSWIDYSEAMADVTAGRHLRKVLHGWKVPGHTDDKTMACLRRPRRGGAR